MNERFMVYFGVHTLVGRGKKKKWIEKERQKNKMGNVVIGIIEE